MSVNIDVLIVYLKRQKNQIHEGGWPIVKRKIRTIVAGISNRIPILYGLYLLLLLTRYLAGTLIRRHSIVNLRRFGSDFADLIQQATTYQSNETNILLMEIERLIKNSNLSGAMALSQQAIAIDCHRPEIWIQMANIFYWQGKYGSVISSHATVAKLLQEESVELGLDPFGVRIISNKLWGFNIGHIGLLDVLVKLSLLGLLSPERRVVFVRLDSVSNLCYLNYWRQHLDIIVLDNRSYQFLETFTFPIAESMIALKLREGFVNLYSAWNLAESLWHSENRPPLLELTEVDRGRGQQVLDHWSIPNSSWFVCLHVREGDTRIKSSGPDSDILTYMQAIKAITSRGGWVIRMGHPGMKALPPLFNVIDYANTDYKTDWMDVFLWATCKFIIGTSSGPLCIPHTFGRPVLLTNATGIGINPNLPNALMVPKLFWSRERERFFTFRETLDGPMGWAVSKVFYGIDGYLADNTPDEIESAVTEMLDKLENSPGAHKDLSDLQKRFNSLRMEYGDTGQMTIAETFAQRHSKLL